MNENIEKDVNPEEPIENTLKDQKKEEPEWYKEQTAILREIAQNQKEQSTLLSEWMKNQVPKEAPSEISSEVQSEEEKVPIQEETPELTMTVTNPSEVGRKAQKTRAYHRHRKAR